MGDYSAAEVPDTGHCGQMSAEPMSELNSDVMDEERSGVCQTKVTAKKKKPDGFPRNGRKGQNQRIPLPVSFMMKSAAKVQKIIDICK